MMRASGQSARRAAARAVCSSPSTASGHYHAALTKQRLPIPTLANTGACQLRPGPFDAERTDQMAPAAAENGTAKRLKTDGSVLHYFRAPGFAEPMVKKLNLNLTKALPVIESVETEFCFNVDLAGGALSEQETEVRALVVQSGAGAEQGPRAGRAPTVEVLARRRHEPLDPRGPPPGALARRRRPVVSDVCTRSPSIPTPLHPTAAAVDPPRDVRAQADARGRQFPGGRAGPGQGGPRRPDLRGRAPAHLLHRLLLQRGACACLVACWRGGSAGGICCSGVPSLPAHPADPHGPRWRRARPCPWRNCRSGCRDCWCRTLIPRPSPPAPARRDRSPSARRAG